MKIVLLSSSLAPDSVSRKVLTILSSKIKGSSLIDAKDISLLEPYWRHQKNEKIYNILKAADGIVIWGGVYNYSMNDSLKVLIDNYFDQNMFHKPIGIVLAWGSTRSFLVWQSLSQILMNEWHMFVWPHPLYAMKTQFEQQRIIDEDLKSRVDYFASNFPIFVKTIQSLRFEIDQHGGRI